MGKKKRNIELTEEEQRQLREARERERAKEQGRFDGRFATRAHEPKKYSRKVKHKDRQFFD